MKNVHCTFPLSSLIWEHFLLLLSKLQTTRKEISRLLNEIRVHEAMYLQITISFFAGILAKKLFILLKETRIYEPIYLVIALSFLAGFIAFPLVFSVLWRRKSHEHHFSRTRLIRHSIPENSSPREIF